MDDRHRLGDVGAGRLFSPGALAKRNRCPTGARCFVIGSLHHNRPRSGATRYHPLDPLMSIFGQMEIDIPALQEVLCKYSRTSNDGCSQIKADILIVKKLQQFRHMLPSRYSKVMDVTLRSFPDVEAPSGRGRPPNHGDGSDAVSLALMR
jgi:hypothetical protein